MTVGIGQQVHPPNRFEYVDRSTCVCGTPLNDEAPRVTRATPWGPVSFLRCVACGSWIQHPQIAGPSLARWYNSDDYQGSPGLRGSVYADYLAQESARLVEARSRHTADIKPWLPAEGGRVLEVGCATGTLLAVLREFGHEVTGIDLSQRFVDAAWMLHGLEIFAGDVNAIELPDAKFDFIAMLGTVSNLSDLPLTLKHLRTLLRPGGTLMLTYPDAASWIAKLYGPRFWMFTPSVCSFLTADGCLATLASCGFTVVHTRIDRQRPCLSKVLLHARLGGLLPMVEALGIGSASLRWALPVPGVRAIWARPSPAEVI